MRFNLSLCSFHINCTFSLTRSDSALKNPSGSPDLILNLTARLLWSAAGGASFEALFMEKLGSAMPILDSGMTYTFPRLKRRTEF